MEQHLKDQLEELLYQYAIAAYNTHYSSASYERTMEQYKSMISVLITVAEKSGIDISNVKASYCGWEYSIEDFSNYEILTKYW